MTTYTAEQIREALGPTLTDRAARSADVYRQIRAGLVDEAIGTLMAGASKRAIAGARRRVRARLTGLRQAD